MTYDDLEEVVGGNFAKILLLPNVSKKFDKINAKARARIRRVMEIYVEEGPQNLISTQFNSENRHPVGDKKGTEVLIHAFKAWQVRVYGSLLGDKKVFICSEIDASKKQDKADPACLRRAAQNLAPYI